MSLPSLEQPTVILRGEVVPLDHNMALDFITDCARNTEQLMNDIDIKAKWVLNDEAWIALAKNQPILQAVRDERERRIASGLTAKEAANREFAKAPGILGKILSNEDILPRHRIDAARELRATAAAGGRDNIRQGESFVVTINLGGDEKRIIELNGIRHGFDGDTE